MEDEIKKRFLEFLKGIHKNPSSSSDYIKKMPFVREWFMEQGICSPDYNIWLDTHEIKNIQVKLNGDFSEEWKSLNKKHKNWYSAPWNKWVEFNKLPMKYKKDGENSKKFNVLKTREILKSTIIYISSKGFQYQEDEIANFYLALKTKPFVILAGISGTGKTQLPRKFAEALGMSKDQVIQVPVRPDWTDGSDLLGYTGLDEEFKPKDLTLAILDANENPEKPFFFILDEMNLARVEHYFSDFLSIIETREWNHENIFTDPILRKETLEKAVNAQKFSGLMWPENLYLIGTVNMDETTHAFSRKVLDRANSIEMNEVNLDWLEKMSENVEPFNGIENSFFRTKFLGSVDLTKKQKDSIKNEISQLKDVNEILKIADLHFAYRVRDEVAFYLILNKEYGLMDQMVAMDFQLVQKVLPRIHGSSERVQTVLLRLFNLLEGTDFRTESFEYDQLDERISEEILKYPRASKKIKFMLKRYEDDRFTSFWL